MTNLMDLAQARINKELRPAFDRVCDAASAVPDNKAARAFYFLTGSLKALAQDQALPEHILEAYESACAYVACGLRKEME